MVRIIATIGKRIIAKNNDNMSTWHTVSIIALALHRPSHLFSLLAGAAQTKSTDQTAILHDR
jgi:hypothetical protein